MPKYFNTTYGPLVWNDRGQIIGGKEWLDADSTPQIAELLKTQELVLVQEPEPNEDQPRTRRSRKTDSQE